MEHEETDLKLARSKALTQRPEVKEAEIDTRRAEYDRRLAKAEYIPDIGAAFRYAKSLQHSDTSTKYRHSWR